MKELVDTLSRSALEIEKRTLAINVFVDSGFKIVTTDFDDMTFEKNGTFVQMLFDKDCLTKGVSIVSPESIHQSTLLYQGAK